MAFVKIDLKEAFSGEPPKNSKVEVKILKSFPDNQKFLIADDSDYCEMVLDNDSPNQRYLHLLEVNKKLRIVNPEYDFEKKTLKIQSITTITEINEDEEEREHSDSEESQSESEDEKVETQLATIEDVMHSFESEDKYLKVKVMHQDSQNVFHVADESGHCYLFAENHEEFLEKGNHLNVFEFHVSKDNTIVLDQNSYVELASEYENHLKREDLNL